MEKGRDVRGCFVKGFKHSKRTKLKISKNHSRHMLGKHHVKKTKEMISKSLMGRYVGKDHPNWNGGVHRDSFGYVWVYNPDHPNATKDGYIRKHRLVMEKHMGRILLFTEIVHHINGNTSDNRIENLMLFSSNSKHSKHHTPTGSLVGINNKRRSK